MCPTSDPLPWITTMNIEAFKKLVIKKLNLQEQQENIFYQNYEEDFANYYAYILIDTNDSTDIHKVNAFSCIYSKDKNVFEYTQFLIDENILEALKKFEPK